MPKFKNYTLRSADVIKIDISKKTIGKFLKNKSCFIFKHGTPVILEHPLRDNKFGVIVGISPNTDATPMLWWATVNSETIETCDSSDIYDYNINCLFNCDVKLLKPAKLKIERKEEK